MVVSQVCCCLLPVAEDMHFAVSSHTAYLYQLVVCQPALEIWFEFRYNTLCIVPRHYAMTLSDDLRSGPVSICMHAL